MNSFYACNCIIEKYTERSILVQEMVKQAAQPPGEYPVEFPVWNLQP